MTAIILGEIYKVPHSIINKEKDTQVAIVESKYGDNKTIISGIPADIKLDNNTEIHTHYIDGNSSSSNDFLVIYTCDDKGECLNGTKLWKTENRYRHRTQKEKENTEAQNLSIATMMMHEALQRKV